MLETQHSYEADCQRLFQLLTDPEFLRAKFEGLGSRGIRVEPVQTQDDSVQTAWSREIPLDPPAVARDMLGAWARLSEAVTWTPRDDGSYEGIYQAQVEGLNGHLSGDLDLRPGEHGSVVDISVKAVVEIPVVGKAVAAYVESEAKTDLDRQQAYTHKYLAET